MITREQGEARHTLKANNAESVVQGTEVDLLRLKNGGVVPERDLT